MFETHLQKLIDSPGIARIEVEVVARKYNLTVLSREKDGWNVSTEVLRDEQIKSRRSHGKAEGSEQVD